MAEIRKMGNKPYLIQVTESLIDWLIGTTIDWLAQ
jgi:hypothetical protein